MIADILFFLTNFVVSSISHLGYAGVAALMAIESAAIPLPSEIIMPFAGSLIPSGRFSLLGIALAGAIGSTIGSWLTYWLGRYGGRPLIEKYGKYILISRRDLNLADKFFSRYGAWSTFIGRILPIVRTYISIPAGITKVPFGLFTATSLFGSFVWSLFLGWLGQKLGANWTMLEHYFRKFDYLIALAIIIFLALWIKRHFKIKSGEPPIYIG
ncbi:DedA family protein [Candidatus Falkowbacteria bacterium]|nr:DedA family protein [Candidatus Falkowbacteria bacterium]